MLSYFLIDGCIGVADNADGSYRVDLDNGSSRLAFQDEIVAAKKGYVRWQINTEATKRILSVYPLEKQSSANLGIYPQAYTDQMIADIAAVIAASNTACDAVDAAVDVSGVDAVVVNWPVIGA